MLCSQLGACHPLFVHVDTLVASLLPLFFLPFYDSSLCTTTNIRSFSLCPLIPTLFLNTHSSTNNLWGECRPRALQLIVQEYILLWQPLVCILGMKTKKDLQHTSWLSFFNPKKCKPGSPQMVWQ